MISERALLALLVGLAACTRYEPGLSLEVAVAARAPSPEWRLERAMVALGWIELGECPELSLRELWIGTAHAHQSGSPTRLVAPVALDLTRSATVTLGTIEPPPGRYCSIHLALAPAGEETQGLAPELSGHTLSLRGAWTAGATISVDSAEVREGQVPLGAAVAIDEDAARAELVVSLGGPAWPNDRPEQLLERLLSTASAR